MSSSLEKLKPAEQRQAALYMPYCPSSRRNALPLALGLYQKSNLEGERQIEGGKNIPFVATWSVSALPSDFTRCRLQFDGDAELSYEIAIPNSEFVKFLIDVLMNYKKNRVVDFQPAFYRKLLRIDD
ncbi:MAG: hypothetical protein HC925_09410 [Coleofasciculaceae cyanobacterium SM2_3_26]|nr:hypothetical protein [Coleofasciculaceae cyanobacterium SM2_3_26]